MKNLRKNNFDLVRFMAAFQVILIHSEKHLKIENEKIQFILDSFLQFFPGVPIFFVISGFLIYSSFERNKNNIIQFAVNRCLRIFPALWVCFLLTLFLLCFDFEGNLFAASPKDMLVWSIGQLTFFQFYTPDILRFWGIGTPNGSLWTIVVELQFYILIPLLYFLFSKFENFFVPFISVFVLSVATNILIHYYNVKGNLIIGKLGSVFVLPYLYYFLIGVACKKYWNKISILFKDKFWLWFFSYFLFLFIFRYNLHFNTISYWIHSPVTLIADMFVAGITLAFSFSFIGLGEKILKGNDISYGLYIYHMVVVNFLINRNMIGKEIYLLTAIIVTIFLASASWLFVEKKALKSKHSVTKAIMSMFHKRVIKEYDH